MPIVHVHLGPQVVAVAKKSFNNLCLARDVEVNGSERRGNVVFSAVLSQNLGPNSNFQWKDRYQVFKADKFRVSTHVFAC